ncbi:MAG: cystathionine gamma-synthase [Acidimicrobiia bacterium]|nr:cystathionine gamma-synthase [Acidimicrobiia bacterium]
MRFETDAIHAGQEPDPTTGAVVVPIYATSTYAQSAPGEHLGYEYSRTGNPTRHALEVALAALEGVTEEAPGGAVATASGMSATALIGYTLRPGDHVLLPNDAYGGTFRFFARVLAEQGVDWSAVDMTDPRLVRTALRPATKVIWAETPTNPMLRLVDIEAVAEISREAKTLFVVDNTFATPYLQRPLDLGADVVLHSTTKYLGGHSDVVGGALVTKSADLFERFEFLINATGPVAGPFDSWLVLRGLKTLAVRMQRHSQNASEIAGFLESHPAVGEVRYPGLDSHPQHDLARTQMLTGGGMISFRPGGGIEHARQIAQSTRLFFLAESLGGVESLIEVPAAMTHASVDGTALEVPADLIRLSVGIEHVDDLLEDLDQALGSNP